MRRTKAEKKLAREIEAYRAGKGPPPRPFAYSSRRGRPVGRFRYAHSRSAFDEGTDRRGTNHTHPAKARKCPKCGV